MNKKVTSLTAGLVLMASVGIANAGDAMQLSASQMDTVAAGTGGYCDLCVFKFIYIKDHKDFTVYSDVYGNSAVAESDAKAFGDNTTAQSFNSTYTDPYTSMAHGTSISVTD
jgi:hypothetical protein